MHAYIYIYIHAVACSACPHIASRLRAGMYMYVCRCICINICIYICIHGTCIYIHMYIYVHIYMYPDVSCAACPHVASCLPAGIYIYVCTGLYVNIYIYMYVWDMHICRHIRSSCTYCVPSCC